jgi:hypothetical protein
MMKKILIAAILLMPFGIYAAQYEYLVKFSTGSGEKSVGAVWQIEKNASGTLMHEVTANMTQTVKCDEKGSALEWSMQAETREGEKVDLKGYRKDNKIYVDGTMKDKPYSKVFDIDERPWYQAVDMQMKTFLDSDKDYTEFWMVGMKPDFDAFTMSFKKNVTETVKVMGKDTDCSKLEWRATGFWSVFWFSDYWFRKSDGIAVKFAMPGGKDPKATSELVKELP